MDVRLPDGTVIKGVPDGMSRADLTAKLAKNGYDVSKLGAPATGSAAIPQAAQLPEADPVRIYETDPNTGQKTSRLQYPSGTRPRQTAKQKQADIDNAARLANGGRAPSTQPTNWLREASGSVLEPVATVGSGILGSLVGNLAGLGKSITGGNFGTQEGVREGKALADRVTGAMTYQPRTQAGGNVVQSIGHGIENSGIAGVPITGSLASLGGASASQLRSMAGVSAAAQGAKDAALVAGAPKLTAGSLADLVRAPKPAGMAGVGAAETAEATLRAQRFANMRAKMQPTKGILSRSIDDVAFEREAAKRPEGRGLDNRFAELNKGMEQHMDALIEETGATASSARATGKAVSQALEAKRAMKKAEIKKAYKEAETSGAMAELVDAKPLLAWVEKNRSAASTASIVTSVEKEIERLSGGTGKMSVNDMEQLRKLTNSLSEPGKPNGAFGKDAINVIDRATEGKGGPAYQQARRLYENYANEFKNRAVIDKLTSTKRGTKDRKVAYEDVADTILLDGSLDDMKHAFRVLEAHPAGAAPEVVAAGQQAVRELRGAAAAKLKERMFSNGGADSAGKVVGSEAQIKRIVAELDKDGKLDYLFGKKGAEEIRDTVKVATDLYSMPKGTVNSSNTASAMEKVLDKLAGPLGGVPVVGHGLKWAAKKAESSAYSKRVNAALNPPNKSAPPARTLGDMTGGQ